MSLCRVGRILLATLYIPPARVSCPNHTSHLVNKETSTRKEVINFTFLGPGFDGRGMTGSVAGGGRYRTRQALERQIGCFSVEETTETRACVRELHIFGRGRHGSGQLASEKRLGSSVRWFCVMHVLQLIIHA